MQSEIFHVDLAIASSGLTQSVTRLGGSHADLRAEAIRVFKENIAIDESKDPASIAREAVRTSAYIWLDRNLEVVSPNDMKEFMSEIVKEIAAERGMTSDQLLHESEARWKNESRSSPETGVGSRRVVKRDQSGRT